MAKKKKSKYTKDILLSTYKEEDRWKIILSDFVSSLAEGMLVYVFMGFLFMKPFVENGMFLLKFYDYIGYVVGYFLIFKVTRRLYDEGDKKERVKVILKFSAIALVIVFVLTILFSLLGIPMEFGVNLNWWMLSIILVGGFAGSAIIKNRI